MKLVELKNYTDKRISIMQVGLRLNPGQTTRVPPSTVSHPAVSPYVGKGLKIVPSEIEEAKAEPIAPAAPVEPTKVPAFPVAKEVSDAPEVPLAPVAPVAEEEIAPEAPAEKVEVPETDGKSLRDAFVEAPGITEENVDKIMGVYPTFKELAAASKMQLSDLGVSKSYAKKLREWAGQQ